MIQLIEEVSRIFEANIRRAEELRAVDLGECCGLEYMGSALADWKDAEPCSADAVVALIEGEYQGLVLCGKCYARLQKRGEL